MGKKSNEIRIPQTGNVPEELIGEEDESAQRTRDEEAQLKADIERTRAGMSETIDALQERLAPERVMAQVKENVQEQAAEALDSAKHAVREATIGKAAKVMDNISDSVNYATRKMGINVEGSSVLAAVRDNPLPFVLIAAGIGMLAMNKRGPSNAGRNYSGGYDSRYRQFEDEGGYHYPPLVQSSSERPGYLDSAKQALTDVASNAKETVSSAAGSIKESAANVADRTREQVNDLSEQAQQRARQASQTFESTLQDYPLAIGIAALAAGVAVGLVLPSTRVESEYMGEARDQLVEKAQTVAKDTVEKVQRVAEEAGRTIQEQAKQQGLTAT